MWNQLYNKMKQWMVERKSSDFIIQSLQNQREMKSTYSGTYDLITLMSWLAMKASEETALSEGVIECEGSILSSVAQLGGKVYE